jgi:hypothetical protein
MEIQSLIDKYIPVTMNSLNIDKGISEVEKDLIIEQESQIPNLVSSSRRNPLLDKNCCFNELPLSNSIKENPFPKTKYILTKEQELKPLDIDSIFNDKNNILINKEKEELKNKKMEIIKNEEYKEYVPKIKMNLTLEQVFSREKNNKWYILKEDGQIGPFNDFNLYKTIRDIYYECFYQGRQIPQYLVKEEKGEIFPMEESFQSLNIQFYKEIQKNIKNSSLYGNKMFFPFPRNPFFNQQQNNNNDNKDNNLKENNNNIIVDKEKDKNIEVKELNVDDMFKDK